MRAIAPSQKLNGLLALGALCLPWAASSPAVDISLRAAFDSPPYILELLETAAEENETAYFPLLDRIADGHFAASTTDEDLHSRFTALLQDEGHLSTPEALSSFQFALSIRSATPRIEAQYQLYNTTIKPSLTKSQSADCSNWIQSGGSQHCSPTLREPKARIESPKSLETRLFDRVTGSVTDAPDAILYADFTDPKFGEFHKTLRSSARQGSLRYRLRYKPAESGNARPLVINGYGVELALKRTDYIVIDDREAKEGASEDSPEQSEGTLEGEDVADIKPLSTSELSQLGLKAASFVMSSEDPLDTLIKLSQDFPKHSSAIASHNVSTEYYEEYKENFGTLLPRGYNMIWANGLQLDAKQINAFALLEHLRRERSLVNDIQKIGFTGQEAISLLSQTAISESKADEEPQRYDFTDTPEGGDVIIWLNNLEKDRRYADWPTDITSFLQRVFPGQLPSVRRDVHNLIAPLDFTNPKDLTFVVEQLQSFVKREVSIRFGIVPIIKSPAASEQAKIVYHLIETYGLSPALTYLETILEKKQTLQPDKQSFQAAIEDRKLRTNRTSITFEQALENAGQEERLAGARGYAKRLHADNEHSFVLVNGVVIPRVEGMISGLSSRVTLDLQTIQRGVYEQTLTEDDWFPSLLLSKAISRRNPAIIPEDDSEVRFVESDVLDPARHTALDTVPRLKLDAAASKESWSHLIVVADLATTSGRQLLREAVRSHSSRPGIELLLLSNSNGTKIPQDLAKDSSSSEDDGTLEKYFSLVNQARSAVDQDAIRSIRALISSLGYDPGQQGLVLNGRMIGPIPSSVELDQDDVRQLLDYEHAKRQTPIQTALSNLQLSSRISSPLDVARLTPVIARSLIEETPEGIYEALSTIRFSGYDQWKTDHTSISVGDQEQATMNIVVSIDPASETAQRWIPILKVLSEFSGVHLRLFLNPKERLDELPIKRFYRHVLDAKPSFNPDGSVKGLSANFKGIPKDALLTARMHVPPSWLVAPQDSVHDLDNIKLSSLDEHTDIKAIYELEHILIQGHSRDVTNGQPPRGVQLVLGTEQYRHFADTIIMANLGYFQFKANPGFWKIDLQAGRSQEIFQIDSAGTKGYAAQLGDESSDIELTSFQGRTLFPRLSRKPGREAEDVLEDLPMESKSPLQYVSKGLKLAENVLSAVGLTASKTATPSAAHADINIFSVASGHLYERMLNIMMLSVMNHTSHSVKFWFIEQFLSPSFKASLPHLAAEYNFQYEMVTYKWPHWLRAQKEKQREIWGYKILFLDVLFPLSLDKIIFVDADQIVRTDMYSLATVDLEGAPYGFTPMCDSRETMEGFRFWKQGYWKTFLRDKPYHISALYVVDLRRFRQIAAGDRLRQQYHQLSADPASLSNLDQDLPNHMQHVLPIYSLDQNWLWCETWCSDESLADAKTIDLCNNPLTKEPKLDRARRQVPEWTVLDEEARAVIKRRSEDAAGAEYANAGGQADSAEPSKNTKSRNHEEVIASAASTTSIKDEL